MQNVCTPFEGKKITLLGLGLLGRGVGDAEFLAQCGARVLVTDKKSGTELAESVEKLKRYPNITFKLGGHDLSDFTSADMVIKAAGVRLDSPEVAAAHAAGVQVAMSTALFAKYASERGAKIVGVTGTRGKSTISHLIYHTLKSAGKRAHLGGNVRGLSTLAMLPEIQEGDTAVLELDSWQLQGFGDLSISPYIAIFTNLMPDHMNYYGDDVERYFADKANVFKFQKQGDTLIVGGSVEKKIRAARPPVDPVAPATIASDWMLKIPGEHNRHNAALAASALLALGLTSDKIQEGLESFEGVEGRLQLLGEVKGIKIYNDNNATTPEATIAALRALDVGFTKPHIVLICGGSDKGLDMSELISAMGNTCKSIVLLAGTGTDRVHATLEQVLNKEITIYHNFPDAISAAFSAANKGDTILFSPAFASFGPPPGGFKNEYDRNDQFVSLVRNML